MLVYRIKSENPGKLKGQDLMELVLNDLIQRYDLSAIF
jgi:hypothetical protein